MTYSRVNFFSLIRDFQFVFINAAAALIHDVCLTPLEVENNEKLEKSQAI
jgi:hypothetical protein